MPQTLAEMARDARREIADELEKEERRRPKRLTNVRVHEVSLVDNPANPHARILIAKGGGPTPAVPPSEGLTARLQRLEKQEREQAGAAALVEAAKRRGEAMRKAASNSSAEASKGQPASAGSTLLDAARRHGDGMRQAPGRYGAPTTPLARAQRPVDPRQQDRDALVREARGVLRRARERAAAARRRA